jgi:hypothetical protein
VSGTKALAVFEPLADVLVRVAGYVALGPPELARAENLDPRSDDLDPGLIDRFVRPSGRCECQSKKYDNVHAAWRRELKLAVVRFHHMPSIVAGGA